MVNTSKIAQRISITIGNLLFRNCFPIYNVIYPRFKRRQDAAEIDFLKRTIKKGDILLDIGANIGFYSKILAQLTGETGKVYCFEPDPTNFNYLVRNTKSISNIIPVNKAVADSTKTIKLYTSKLLNVDHRTYKVDEYEKELSIEAISIDDFTAGKFKVDFIKMDIQGFEFSALKGMVKTLAGNPDIKLLMEIAPQGLQEANTIFEDFFSFFRTNELKLFRLDTDNPVPYDGSELVSGQSYPSEYYFNVWITH